MLATTAPSGFTIWRAFFSNEICPSCRYPIVGTNAICVKVVPSVDLWTTNPASFVELSRHASLTSHTGDTWIAAVAVKLLGAAGTLESLLGVVASAMFEYGERPASLVDSDQ